MRLHRILFLALLVPCVSKGQLPALNKSFHQATAHTRGELLTVSTGKMERTWRWTGKGLVTVDLKNLQTVKEWKSLKTPAADWAYYGLIDETKGELIRLTAEQDNDEHFTSDFLKVTAEVNYPSVESSVRYEIWIYPGAPGIRTQVFIKGNGEKYLKNVLNAGEDKSSRLTVAKGKVLKTNSQVSSAVIEQFGRTDFLPVSPTAMTRRLIGYYNNTQNRNTAETPLIREITNDSTFRNKENYDWPSILSLEDKTDGVMVVKESHKCVNQYGVETGDFELNKEGICNRGTSLYPKDILPDHYRWCWATWTIVYTAGEFNRELALKEFDRTRYPIDATRDIYIQANTWGSGRNRDAAVEANVLKEIEVQSKLGIDIQQIDDGWQDQNWRPKKEAYPEGWKNVVESAKAKNVKLGLWAAAIPITLDALKDSYDNGKFVNYKLDFASFDSHDKIDQTIQKVREFIKYTHHKVRVNWDVTENAPRFGYFWAREYGCVYLENRKPATPVSVIYIPYLVLRDIWHLSKYANVNKFQTSIQNIDKVDRNSSNAYLYSNPYAVAIGLIGTPLFFEETQFYKEEELEKIKPLLDAYKKHRNEIYNNFTFPIGDEPNDASYTGFQNYRKGASEGYLFLFRELKNKEAKHNYKLEYLKDKQLELTDIQTGTKSLTRVNNKGEISIAIDKPAQFKIYKFKIRG